MHFHYTIVKMKIFHFCWLGFSLINFNDVICGKEDNFDGIVMEDFYKYPSLLTIRNKSNRYKLAIPKIYSPISNNFEYPISKGLNDLTYFMCPDGSIQNEIEFPDKYDSKNRKALYIKQFTTEEPKLMGDVRCFFEVEPIISQLLNNNMKSWYNDIQLFGIGFQFFVNDIEPAISNYFTLGKFCLNSTCYGTSTNDEGSISNTGNRPTTEDILWRYDIEKGYEFIPLVSVYFDQQKQQTIAVSYELIPTELPLNIATTNFNIQTIFKNTFFFEFMLKKQDYQKLKFRKILGEKQNYITDEIYFVGQPLVSENDFLVPLWKKAAQFKFYKEPMWNVLTPKWEEIQNWSKGLTKKFGKLFITNGISGILSFLDEDNNLKPADINNNEKDKISFPALFWKKIEFKDGEDRKPIVIIMHNNPYKKEEKICTDISEQLEWKNNFDFKTGLTYVCDFTKEIEEKLDINFILPNGQIPSLF